MIQGADRPTASQWGYCINPHCHERLNPSHLKQCQTCGTELRIGDRYRLVRPLRHLGSTYLTEVFEVEDEVEQAVKVMKVLTRSDRKLVELFEREAEVLQRLDHPGIPKIDDLGCFQVTPAQWNHPVRCLVMERIEGEDLQRWMTYHPPISQPLALAWLKQLADILHQIHQNHLFHRDIKPSNIMLRPAEPWGQLTLIDFGTVREVSQTVLEGRDSTVVYSDGYTAPEQIRGRATPQSDFYALGRTFIHLLTQTHPNELPEDEHTHNLDWQGYAPHIAPLLANLVSDLADEEAIARPRNSQDLLDRLAEVQVILTPTSMFSEALEPMPYPMVTSHGVTDVDVTRLPLDDDHQDTRPTVKVPWWRSHQPLLATCGVLVGLVALLLVSWGRREWQRQQMITAQRLLAQSELLLPPAGQELKTSLQLAIEAWQRLRSLQLPTLPAEDLIQAGLSRLPRSQLRIVHDDDVNAVALSATGRYWATASADGTAQVWQVVGDDDRSVLITTLQHGAAVNTLAFSADERYLATASQDQTVQLWDGQENEARVLSHGEAIQAIAFSGDGSQLVTAGASTVTVWDVVSGERLAERRRPTRITAMAVHPNQAQVAIASVDGQVDLWRWDGAESALIQQDSPVQAIAFSPDGQVIATGSPDRTARLWDVATQTEVRRWLHAHSVVQVVFSQDGQRLVTATGSPLPLRQGHSAQVWDVQTGEAIAQVAHQGNITDVALSDDGTLLATASFDRTAQVWDLTQNTLVAQVQHQEAVMGVTLTQGRQLGTASLDNTAQLWELVGNPALTVLEEEGPILAIAFSPVDSLIAVSSGDGTLSLWHEDGRRLRQWQTEYPVHTLTFSPDGQILAATNHRNVQLWQPDSGSLLLTLPPMNPVNAIAFSPDGQYLATASTDTTARVWETRSGLEVARLTHDSFVESVTFSPDGAFVATASLDNTARIWDWQQATPQELARLEHGSFVESVLFSPDGQYIATASLDNTARLWDWRKPGTPEVHRLTHTHDVNAIAFSPDGQYLATVSGPRLLQPSQNDTIQVWTVDQGQSVLTLADQSLIGMGGFSPDSQYLSTVSQGQGVQLWQISSRREVARLRRIANPRSSVFSPSQPMLGVTGARQVWLWSWSSVDLIDQACDRLALPMTRSDWRHYIGREPYRPACGDRSGMGMQGS
ncbi:MAG: protein kinase [Elainellaceae cyanobacterium]